MQDIQVARHSSFVGSRGLVVDPSIISVLLNCNSNKQGQNSRKSKTRNHKPLRNQPVVTEPAVWQPFACPMKSGAVSEKTRPASEASDTTTEPFDNHLHSSDSESPSGSGGSSSHGLERNEALRALHMPHTSKLSMPRQPGLQMDCIVERKQATTNSSPADFAAAWTQAASTGAWKRDGKKQRGVGQNLAPREHQKALKDMPLPKWFVPAEQKALPLPIGAANLPTQVSRGQISPTLVPPPGLDLAPALTPPPPSWDAALIEAAHRMQLAEPRCQPLKIFVPGREGDLTHLNLGMPVKKCVPEWEF